MISYNSNFEMFYRVIVVVMTSIYASCSLIAAKPTQGLVTSAEAEVVGGAVHHGLA